MCIEFCADQRFANAGPPIDGMTYLRSVVYEASKISNVHVSAVDPRQFDKQQVRSFSPPALAFPLNPLPSVQTRFVAVRNHSFAPPPAGLETSMSWAMDFSQKFENLRQQIEALRLTKPKKHPSYPSYKDEAAWHKFCFGLPLPSANTKPTTEAMQVEGEPAPIAEFTFPPLQSLLQIDEVRVTSLLNYHITWLVADQNTATILSDPLFDKRLSWIFILLALVDKPLDGDTSANLRMLLRVLCRIRSTKVSSPPYLFKPLLTTPPQTAFAVDFAQMAVLISLLSTSFGQAETAQ